jgi:hypothetical protein
MKTTIVFFTCIVLTFSVSAQTEKQTMLDIDKTINDIKSKISTFQKIEKINTNDGYRFVFLKDKELQLITVRQIEENVEKNVEWYYVNGVLIYAETIWLDSTTKKIVKNEKLYLDSEHLIAWINTENKLVDNNSSEFKTVSTELVAYGIKIKTEALK